MTDKIPGNTTHGGAGAYKKIQKGEEFVGLARIAQREVEERLEVDGVEGELLRDAKRLQVVSDLYYPALMYALKAKDYDKATAILKTWVWEHNSTIRAWEAIRKHKKPDNSEAEYQKIIDLYRVKEEENAPDN